MPSSIPIGGLEETVGAFWLFVLISVGAIIVNFTARLFIGPDADTAFTGMSEEKLEARKRAYRAVVRVCIAASALSFVWFVYVFLTD